MSDLKKNEQQDWTRLLTDPELVGHIGKLLQAYREAAPEKREEALLAAMRQIRKQSAAAKPSAAPAPAKTQQTATSASTESKIEPLATSSTQQAVGQAASSSGSSTSQASTQVPSQSPSSSMASSSAAAAAAVIVEAPGAQQLAVQSPDVQSSAIQSNVHPAVATAQATEVQPPFSPDLFTPSFGQDRRTYPRIRCFIAVELRCEGWETPVWGNLANVSAGGCFIETVEPVRKSTKLEVGLWANNGKVWVKGIVINGIVTENNPTFGLRLRYTDMDASERETLRFFLKFVEDTTKNYEKQNGYLSQMKR